jgi:hypothetical protein
MFEEMLRLFHEESWPSGATEPQDDLIMALLGSVRRATV